jgi:hypothetical protein
MGVRADRAEALDETLRHGAQQPVSFRVTERVVDELELVQVDQEHAHQATLPPRLLDRGLEQVVEEVPVAEPGERVVVGQVAHLLLDELALGDVLHRPLDARHTLGEGDLCPPVEEALGTVERDAALVELERRRLPRAALERLAESDAIVRVHARQNLVLLKRAVAGVQREDASQLVGGLDLAGLGVEAPVADSGQVLRVREPGAALAQLGERALQALQHQVEGARDVSDLVVPADRQAHAELAPPDRLGCILNAANRSHESPRDQQAESESQRQRERTSREEFSPGLSQGAPLGLECGADPEVEIAHPARRPVHAPGRHVLSGDERHIRSRQLRPQGQRLVGDRLCSEQPAERALGRLDRDRGHSVGARLVVQNERSAHVTGDPTHLEHPRREIGVTGDGGGPAVCVQEQDDGRSLQLRETAREVAERRLVACLQVGT